MNPRHARPASWILSVAAVVVGPSVLLAHYAADASVRKLFDNVHWTVSYGAAAALAWLGVRSAETPQAAHAKRWFAWGLSSPRQSASTRAR